jgi:hypothetical protein
MVSHRLKYVQGIVDRHGHPRFYFRRPGFARVTLPGSPWSQEFVEAYQRANSLEPAALKVGSEKVKPRSIHALAIAYYDSRAFNDLKPISKASIATSSSASVARPMEPVNPMATRAPLPS